MGIEYSKHGFEEKRASVDVERKDKPSCKEVLKRSMTDISLEKLKYLITGVVRLDKLKSLMLPSSAAYDQFTLWAIGVTTVMLLLWLFSLQLSTPGDTVGPTAIKFESAPYFPPRRVYKNEVYLMVSSNGGLNQMRTICDMVSIARFLNVTLVVPELDKTSFWHDSSQFKDIWDVDFFIKSLRDELRIIKQLPDKLKKKVHRYALYSMPPVCWSNISYYYKTVFPHFQRYTILGNNLPLEVQKLLCRVNYEALRFTPAIEEMGKKIIKILRDRGPFLVLHLRYEMNMLAFSGCTEGCNQREVEEPRKLRYAIPWWKEKEIDPKRKREAGFSPLTPEEIALTLRAFDINPDIQVYIAAGNIYGGERRMSGLRAFYPNLVKKETLLQPSDLKPFQNHSNRLAALDYLVSLDSDIFVPTYGGNMANVVEGHRRYLGYKMTINLDRLILTRLIDQYKNGTLSWKEFSESVKAAHANRLGSPSQRLQFPDKPKQEDCFYVNPQECLPPVVVTTNDRKPVTDKGQLSFP